MAKLNMAKVNTLLRKGYLLAGVIMAANMFIINEMKATDTTLTTNIKETREPEEENNTDRIFLYTDDIDQEDKDEKAPETQPKQNIMDKVLSNLLSYENSINFFGGLFFSVANNYLKLWDYNPGGYWNLRIGCLGLRSKRLLNGMLQFEGNLNLGRGAFWLIATLFGSYEYLKQKKNPKELTNTAAVIMNYTWTYDTMGHILFVLLSSLQGFVSAPLAIHISNFSIAISLDSILWVLASGLSTIVRGKKKNEEDIIFNLLEKGETENNNQEGNDIN